MTRLRKAITAGTEDLSRQMRYKVIRFRLGQCINCGNERGDSPYKRLCKQCGFVRRKARRQKMGSRAWKAGSPGRPPLSAKPSQNDTEENQ